MAIASESPKERPNLWLAAVCVLYAALATTYCVLALWRYDIFRAGVDDGAFTQIVHGAFDGFSSTLEGGANHLLVHASPILILAVPFVLFFHGAPGLAILQVLLTSAVVFPVWAIASTRLAPPFAFAVTLLAACYPPLSALAVGDFHELAFAPLLTACLVLAIDRRAWRYAVLCAIVLVCVKEDQFVGCAFAGILVVLTAAGDRAQRRCGWWITTISVAAALLYFGVVRRAIDPTFPYWSLHYYQWWWNPPTPAGFVSWDSLARPLYMLAVFAPLAFLPLGSRYVLFAIPGFAEVMLSHEGITLALNTHYSATWCGYLLCAFADAAGKVGRRSQVALGGLLAIAFGVAVWTSTYQSPIGPGYALYRHADERDAGREQLLRSLPPKASVWSHDPIFAHLGMDPNATITLKDQDYLIFDLDQDAVEYASQATVQLIKRGNYTIVRNEAGLVILRKNDTL